MQLNTWCRKKLKKAKTLCSPRTIAFETGKIYLVGSDISARLDIENDLVSSLIVQGLLCYEGESSVSSIINMLAEGQEFVFQGTELEIQSRGGRALYRSIGTPTHRIPESLRIYEDISPSLKYTFGNPAEIAGAIEYAALATKSKKGGIFSDRIFISDRKGELIVYGTNNTILNMVKCGPVNLTGGQDVTDIILAGKSAVKVAKLLKEEQLKCILTKHIECVILCLKSIGIYIKLPYIMGDTPDIKELMLEVAKCDNKLEVESAPLLVPPKEIMPVGEYTTINISPGSNVRVSMNHPGGRSSFDTEIPVSSFIPMTNIIVKKNEFFPSLSGLPGVFYIQWIGTEPVFIVLKDQNRLSVHATVLGG